MKIFDPIGVNGYEFINMINPENWEALSSFDGSSRLDGWLPFEVFRVRKDRGKTFKDSDFLGLTTTMILREHAVDVLRDILEKNGEILPLSTADDVKLFAYNVRAIDALDEDASDLIRFTGSNRIMMIKRVAFIADKIEGIEVFRLPHRGSPTYVNEEFVSRIKKAGLKGRKFNQVWP